MVVEDNFGIKITELVGSVKARPMRKPSVLLALTAVLTAAALLPLAAQPPAAAPVAPAGVAASDPATVLYPRRRRPAG